MSPQPTRFDQHPDNDSTLVNLFDHVIIFNLFNKIIHF